MATKLTPEQIELAKSWRSTGMGWRRIGETIGVSRWALVKHFDPVTHAKEKARNTNFYYLHRKSDRPFLGEVRGRPVIPDHVMEERNRAFSSQESIGVLLLGDPRPTRSAWDKRNGE